MFVLYSYQAQLKEVTNIEGFSSGRIIEKSSFLYTFDKCGDYAVVSQGAPGFSCVVHIKEPSEYTFSVLIFSIHFLSFCAEIL